MPNQSIKLNQHASELFNTHWNTENDSQNSDDKTPIYPILACGNTLLKCIHQKPNIFVIENFLSDFETNHLLNISTNNMKHFELSYTQPTNSTQHIYSAQRTSTHLFLPKSGNKIINSIENRAANIVGVANKNVEQLQIVRYTKGQRFDLHHDAGTLRRRSKLIGQSNTYKFKQGMQSNEEYEYSVDVMLPIRICSFFVYLTSLPPQCGGETYFPKIGLKMRPQKGTAILWSNVSANNILKADPMVMHKACPVIGNNVKMGMNIWIKH